MENTLIQKTKSGKQNPKVRSKDGDPKLKIPKNRIEQKQPDLKCKKIKIQRSRSNTQYPKKQNIQQQQPDPILRPKNRYPKLKISKTNIQHKSDI